MIFERFDTRTGRLMGIHFTETAARAAIGTNPKQDYLPGLDWRGLVAWLLPVRF